MGRVVAAKKRIPKLCMLILAVIVVLIGCFAARTRESVPRLDAAGIADSLQASTQCEDGNTRQAAPLTAHRRAEGRTATPVYDGPTFEERIAMAVAGTDRLLLARSDGSYIIEADAKERPNWSIYLPKRPDCDDDTAGVPLVIYFNGATECGMLNLGSEYKEDQFGGVSTLTFQEDIINAIVKYNGDCIVAVSKWAIPSFKYVEQIKPVIDTAGIAVSEVLLVGWSDGGNGTLRAAKEILDTYPEYGVPTLVWLDCNATAESSYQNWDACCSAGCKIVYVSNQTFAESLVRSKKLQMLIRYPMDLYFIGDTVGPEAMASKHMSFRDDAIADNIVGYVLGRVDGLTGEYNKSTYLYYYYDYSVWNTVQDSSAEIGKMIAPTTR